MPLDEEASRAAAERARDEGFGAVAVALLFSLLNPAHELRVEEIMREELDGRHDLALAPRRARMARVRADVVGRPRGLHRPGRSAATSSGSSPRCEHQGLAVPLHVMQSSGGVVTRRVGSANARCRRCSRARSAGRWGVVALARTLERPNLICVDMGGTSFDVSL